MEKGKTMMDRDRELHEMADEGRALMNDYIKREDAIRVARIQGKKAQFDGMLQDVAPVRHGRWIVGDSLPMHDIAGNLSWGNWYTCNQCEFKTYAIEHHITQYNYCPNCGAKMGGNK